MKLLAILIFALPLAAQSKFVGRLDATTSPNTAPMQVGTSLPAACSVGDLFYKTDATAGQNLYGCTSTNTWTQQAGGGGGGGAVLGTVAITGTTTMTYPAGNTGNVYRFTTSANVAASSPSTNPDSMQDGVTYYVRISNVGGFTLSGGPTNFTNFPNGVLPTSGVTTYSCVWSSALSLCVGGISTTTTPYSVGSAVAFSTLPATCPANVPQSAWINDGTKTAIGSVAAGGGSSTVELMCSVSGGNWIVVGSNAPLSSPTITSPSLGAGSSPITETWPVGTGGVTANTLVQTDGSAPLKIVNATTGVYGIATASVSATGSAEIARYGTVNCVADTGGATAGDLVIIGTGTVIDCKDSGQTSSANIPIATRIVGVFRSTAIAGALALVELTPAHFGTQVSGGGLTDACNGTGGHFSPFGFDASSVFTLTANILYGWIIPANTPLCTISQLGIATNGSGHYTLTLWNIAGTTKLVSTTVTTMVASNWTTPSLASAFQLQANTSYLLTLTTDHTSDQIFAVANTNFLFTGSPPRSFACANSAAWSGTNPNLPTACGSRTAALLGLITIDMF